jgi:hypothetical protein
MLANLHRSYTCWTHVWGCVHGAVCPGEIFVRYIRGWRCYVPSFDQAAAKAAKMPSSRANTAVDLMAVDVGGSNFKSEFKTDRELYKQRETTVACASVARRTAGDWKGTNCKSGPQRPVRTGTGVAIATGHIGRPLFPLLSNSSSQVCPRSSSLLPTCFQVSSPRAHETSRTRKLSGRIVAQRAGPLFWIAAYPQPVSNKS